MNCIMKHLERIYMQVLYATALNVCEPWEQKLACGILMIILALFLMSILVLIPSELMVFIDFFLFRAFNNTEMPSKNN
uniref:Uncharacterized protein n=1 Tax=Mesocestoides corti TaxID=53468 RepID=A0A5K3FEB6_MESCO